MLKDLIKTALDETEADLIFKNGKYFLDEKKTNARREKLIGLQDSLFD